MLRAAAQRSRGLRRAGTAGPRPANHLLSGPKADDETKQMGRDKEQQPQNKTKLIKPPNPKGHGYRVPAGAGQTCKGGLLRESWWGCAPPPAGPID